MSTGELADEVAADVGPAVGRRRGPPTAGSRSARPRPAPRWAGTSSERRRAGRDGRRRPRSRSCLPPPGRRRRGGDRTPPGARRPCAPSRRTMSSAALAVPLVAGERGEAQQSDGGEPVAAGRGVVHQVLAVGDELLGVAAGGEHAAALVVPEQVEQRIGGGCGPRRSSGPRRSPRPAARTRRRARRGRRRRRGARAPAVALPRPQPAPVGAAAATPAGTRPRPRPRRSRPARLRPHRPRPRRRSSGAFHSVSTLSSSPGRTRRSRCSNSAWRAASTSAGRSRSPGVVKPAEDRGALEVAAGGHAVPLDGGLRGVAEHRPDLRLCPDVELALHAFAVGILGRREPALGLAQVAQHVADGLRRRPGGSGARRSPASRAGTAA